MGVKVTLASTNQNRISINNQSRETIRTVRISSLADRAKMSSLQDVDSSDADTGETLVYDASTRTYVVRTLPSVDGGQY